MAIVPQLLFFYDQLPLWLIPRTARQSATLSLTSWIAYEGWKVTTSGTTHMGLIVAQAAIWVIVGIYLPALGLVYWQERSSIQVAVNKRIGFDALQHFGRPRRIQRIDNLAEHSEMPEAVLK
jgi:hypothetical protein